MTKAEYVFKKCAEGPEDKKTKTWSPSDNLKEKNMYAYPGGKAGIQFISADNDTTHIVLPNHSVAAPMNSPEWESKATAAFDKYKNKDGNYSFPDSLVVRK